MTENKAAGCGDRIIKEPNDIWIAGAIDIVEISAKRICKLASEIKEEVETEEPSLAYIRGKARELKKEVMRILEEV